MPSDPYITRIRVRFRDLDTMGHVNNALYATYLEEARTDYYHDVLGLSLPDIPTVLVHLEIDFKAEIALRDRVEVAVDVPRLGESSIPMEYEIRANDSLAATAETVQVTWDREAGATKPIPEPWREHFAAYEDF